MDLIEQRKKAINDLIEGNKGIVDTVEELSKPMDIYVEPTHPMMMENPLTDKETYAPLVTDQFSGNAKTEMLRVKDNELAKEVLTSGTIDILDKRVSVNNLNQGDLNLLGAGTYGLM